MPRMAEPKLRWLMSDQLNGPRRLLSPKNHRPSLLKVVSEKKGPQRANTTAGMGYVPGPYQLPYSINALIHSFSAKILKV